MTEADIVQYTLRGLIVTLVLSLPPIVVTTIVSLLISFVQAITQVQEQTISFLAKLVAVFATIYFLSGWYGEELYNFSLFVFDNIPYIEQ